MTLGSPLVRVLLAGPSAGRSAPAHGAPPPIRGDAILDGIFKGPRAVRVSTPPGGDSKPGTLVMSHIPWTLKEGANSGGLPDFVGRLRSRRPKASLNNNSSFPNPPKPKEKPAGLRRRA